ncbi:MAG: hypothetical protein AAF799_48265 [Myxococcota bacterium]
MLRPLFASALLLLGACKNDEADKTQSKTEAKAEVEPAAKDEPPAPSEAGEQSDDEPSVEPRRGKGLTGAIGEVVGGVEPSKHALLIPDGATVLLGIDLSAVVSHPLLPILESRLRSRQREQLRAAKACGVGLSQGKTFVIGMDLMTRNVAMVVEAKGLGTRKTLQCMAKEIGNFTLSEDGKTLSDHTGGGIVLDDDAVAFASPAWMDPLRERIAGKGKAAVEGSAREAFARAKPSRPLWLAGEIPAYLGAMAAGVLGAQPSMVLVDAKLGETVDVEVAVQVPDPAATQRGLQEKWNALRGFAVSSGVPRTVSESLKISNDDEMVRIEVQATPDEIDQLLRTAEGGSRGF